MQRIRKGDEVIVICGRDKGTKGTVLSRVDDRHVLVEGVNVVKKHVRPNPALGVAGGIVDKTMPIDQSNVMLVNPETGKGDRVGFQIVDGKKVRVCAKCGAALDKAYVKAVKAEAKAAEEAPKKRTRKRTAKAEAETETKSEE